MIFANGGPPITGDNLNQFATAYDTVATLRGVIGTATVQGVPQIAELQGFTSPGDGGQGPFYWNANSTTPDDGGITTVVPYGSVQGAWVRINPVPVVPFVIKNSGSITLSNNITVSNLITSISLGKPGVWLVFGYVMVTIPSGCTLTEVSAGISGIPTLAGSQTTYNLPTFSTAGPTGQGIGVPPFVDVITVPTGWNLLVQSTFSGSPFPTASGSLEAVFLGSAG